MQRLLNWGHLHLFRRFLVAFWGFVLASPIDRFIVRRALAVAAAIYSRSGDCYVPWRWPLLGHYRLHFAAVEGVRG